MLTKKDECLVIIEGKAVVFILAHNLSLAKQILLIKLPIPIPIQHLDFAIK